MDIAAAVDMERLREVMTELVERCAAVARRYGGTVEYTGDGVMALFGAPVALEDHAFRACLAALAIQEEANRLAAEVQRSDGVALRLRVGLNSGQVIAGEIGSGSLEEAVRLGSEGPRRSNAPELPDHVPLRRCDGGATSARSCAITRGRRQAIGVGVDRCCVRGRPIAPGPLSATGGGRLADPPRCGCGGR
jgi:Adenylate and Guanylate cyclase catalytic domain